MKRLLAAVVVAGSLALGIGASHADKADAAFYTYRYTNCYSSGWCRVTTVVCSDTAPTFIDGGKCQYFYYWYQWTDK